MLDKLYASMVEDDHSFLHSLIGLSFLSVVAVFWIGIQMPGNPVYLPNMISVSPGVAESIEHVKAVIEPELKAMVIRPLVAKQPQPAPVVTRPTVEVTPEPLGGGVLKRIVFASNRESRMYQLYMIDSNGQNLERLTYSDSFDRDPHVSYDGNIIAFSSNRLGSYQIFLFDIDSRKVTQLTKGSEDKTNPIWSPDNKKILYTSHKGSTSYLCLMNADGTKREVITKPGGNHYGYGFSHDNTQISFEAINRDNHEIFLYDLVTRKTHQIVDYDGLTDVGDPVFSPKTNMLVFTSDSLKHHRRQLYIYDDMIKQCYRITKDHHDKDDPSFSPDGKMIAYIAKWQNAWNIYVMNADGTNQRNITKSPYDHVVPTWR